MINEKNVSRRNVLIGTTAAMAILGGNLITPQEALADLGQTLTLKNKTFHLHKTKTKAQGLTSSLSFSFTPRSAATFYARTLARRDTKNYYSALVVYYPNRTILYVEKNVNGKATLLTQTRITAVNNPTIELYVEGDKNVTLKARVYATGTTPQADHWTLTTTDTNNPLKGAETGYAFYYNDPSTAVTAKTWAMSKVEFKNTVPTNSPWGKVVFEDNFNGTSVDTSKWNILNETYVGYDSGWILSENATVNDGTLKIALTKRDVPKRTKNGIDPKTGAQLYKDRPYNTAYLDSRGKFAQVYGKWEFRAKIPASKDISAGVWCGVWLRPEDRSIQGEVDIAESFGSRNSETKTSIDVTNITTSTLHFRQDVQDKIDKRIPQKGQNLETEWHTWTFERTPETFKFYFDHELFYTVKVSDYQAKMDKSFPTNKPMGILINVQAASPGSYWGGINENTKLPSIMEIDYIRAWEYKG